MQNLWSKINNYFAGHIGRQVAWLFFVVLFLDLCSLVTYSNTLGLSIITLVCFAIWLVLAFKNINYGLGLMLLELIVGSQGYWLKLTIDNTAIPLRMLMFAGLMAWLAYKLLHKDRELVLQDKLFWQISLPLLVAIIWSMVVGYYHNEFNNWFLDLNGYLFLLVWPVIYFVYKKQVDLKFYVPFILVGLLALSLKTIGLLFIFTHISGDNLMVLYKWVRDSGWGEITSAGGGNYRIFSQSHIWLAAGAGMALVLLQDKFKNIKENYLYFIGTIILIAGVIISLSRSMWLGLAASLLVVVIFGLLKKQFKQTLYFIIATVVLIVCGWGLVMATNYWPYPTSLVGAGGSVNNRFAAGEAAGESRLRLLEPLWNKVIASPVLGSGFGATLTYRSLDPRIVNSTAGGSGEYTTYAFEWGYLDLLFKFGLVAGVCFLFFWLYWLWQLIIKNWQNKNEQYIYSAALAGLVVLLVTNITTPYLNHPLGIGLGLGCILILLVNSNKIPD